jgi:hypothetical protein
MNIRIVTTGLPRDGDWWVCRFQPGGLTGRWLQRLERLNSVTSVSPVSFFWPCVSLFSYSFLVFSPWRGLVWSVPWSYVVVIWVYVDPLTDFLESSEASSSSQSASILTWRCDGTAGPACRDYKSCSPWSGLLNLIYTHKQISQTDTVTHTNSVSVLHT